MRADVAASESTVNIRPMRYQFGFSGTIREYFGIWIVNLLLTIVTLGIYSAWAKVRTNRYFYGNTLVAGSAFEYTADPVRILIGRLIAVALLALYILIVLFLPSVAISVLITLLLVVPAIYLSSLSFKMRYSIWRGINFRFEQNIPRAYLLFSPLLLYIVLINAGPVLFGLNKEDFALVADASELSPVMSGFIVFNLMVVLSGVLLFPLWQQFYYKFIGNHAGFGKSRFGITLPVAEFYLMYLLASGVGIVGGVILYLIAYRLNIEAVIVLESIYSFYVCVFIGLILLYVIIFAVIQTRLTNLVYSAIRLENMRFESTLDYSRMILLYLTNSLAIIFSLGMAIPWVRVRMARYRADNMYLLAIELDAIAAQSSNGVNSGEDAMTDIFDMDIGL